MRPLSPEIFWSAPPIENKKLDMSWFKPIVFIEAPGTSPYDIFVHWHRRSQRDTNYVGFMDLLLNVRGIDDNELGPVQTTKEEILSCHVPFMQGSSAGIDKFTGPALEAYQRRLSFARGLFTSGKHALIRYYTEPEPEGFVNERFEDVFFPYARLVFVEKRYDPLMNLIRMVRLKDNQDSYEIPEDVVYWYIDCLKRYQFLKSLFLKKSAVLSIDDYHKGFYSLKWPDGPSVGIDLNSDSVAKKFAPRIPAFKAPSNFQTVQQIFKQAWK